MCEHLPAAPGSEEYLHSEKYEVRHWDLDESGSLAPLLARLNAVRRAHPALQTNRSLRFHDVDGDGLLCYSKRSDAGDDVVLTVVNIDPHRSERARCTSISARWASGPTTPSPCTTSSPASLVLVARS